MIGRKGKKKTTVNSKKKRERERKRENHRCIIDYCRENDRLHERINLHVKPKKKAKKKKNVCSSRHQDIDIVCCCHL